MEPLRRVVSLAVPLGGANIDTDQIVPARYLQKPRSCDFGDFLFHDIRRRPDGSLRADFVLNDARYDGAQILVAGRNFGCGSSREHAVWALYDGGFRAVIAAGFGDIFRSNALKNGLLPVELAEPTVESLLEALRGDPRATVEVDLVAEAVTLPDGLQHPFAVDAFARHCLIEGIDEIDYTLSQLARIEAYERTSGMSSGTGGRR
jgi:3-isopropylmalate/(R)-2-methylmalate dehydratase small subunit